MAEKVKTKCPLCGDVLSAGGYEAKFSADIGATCFRLFYKPLNAEILRTPNGESQRNTNVYLFGNPILFPPNRIRGGRFVFRGKEYVLPVNEPQTGCFIHGNLLNLPFAKKQISQSEIEFTYSAKKGEYLGFPHDFTVRRHYKLGENGLEEYTTVINDGVCEMPVMLAYHTTFNLDFYGDMQNVKLQVPVTQEYLRDKNFLPTGETAYGRPRDLALANGEFVPAKQPFSAFYKANDKTVALFKGAGASVYYEAESIFGYRMLYRGDGDSFAVCEPQTCVIDCFHFEQNPEELGLIVLPGGENKTFYTRICIEKDDK